VALEVVVVFSPVVFLAKSNCGWQSCSIWDFFCILTRRNIWRQAQKLIKSDGTRFLQ